MAAEVVSPRVLRIGKHHVDLTDCPRRALIKVHKILIEAFPPSADPATPPEFVTALRALHLATNYGNTIVDLVDLRNIMLNFARVWWEVASLDLQWGGISDTMTALSKLDSTDVVKAKYEVTVDDVMSRIAELKANIQKCLDDNVGNDGVAVTCVDGELKKKP